MRRQEGVTLTGFIIVAVIVIFGLLLAFKIGPSYFEYYTIQKQLKALAADPAVSGGTRKDLETAFVARAIIENIRVINAGDLQITKDANGFVISAEYSTKVPIFGNMSACMDFAPSSAK